MNIQGFKPRERNRDVPGLDRKIPDAKSRDTEGLIPCKTMVCRTDHGTMPALIIYARLCLIFGKKDK